VSALEELWWDPSAPRALRAALGPLALAEGLFRAGAALRRAAYDAGLARAERAGAPVVSIGNLAVGGAGKTPVALAVAERLVARGRTVAVLSRGYGARRGDARVVTDGARLLLDARDAGDEPYLVARRLPGVRVLCGPRRVALARVAVERLGADALVLDDGFQHRALARDLDVVVVDAANPVGNGRLLPRGPNREPWSALRRASLAWLSRVDGAGPEALDRLRAAAREATGRDPVESRHGVVDVLDGALERASGPGALSGRRVLLVCALARPGGFRRTLATMGAEVAGERVFRDHHAFTDGELDEASRAADALRCDAIATTEKDAVRLPPTFAADPRVRVVRIAAEITAGAELLDALLEAALASATPPFALSGAERSRRATPDPTATPPASVPPERSAAGAESKGGAPPLREDG
jgi:tetraacyldisaccharide 4'-kinase